MPHGHTPRASSTSPRSRLPSRALGRKYSATPSIRAGSRPRWAAPYATGDLELGNLTQSWLAVSNDAAATVSGGYWYHRQRQAPAPQARDPAFQDQLIDRLAALTGVALF